MLPVLIAAGSTAAKSELTKDVISGITNFVKGLFGGIGGGGGADGMNKRDEARIARATVYAVGVRAGSVDAARYMLGTQSSRGAATERAMYDKLVAQMPSETMATARQLGGLQDSDSGKQGLQTLLTLGVGLDMPRLGCMTSTGDPDPACAGIVTRVVALARSAPSTQTAPAAGAAAAPNAPGTPAPGTKPGTTPPAAARGSSALPLVLLLVGLVVLVQFVRGKL